MRRARLVRGHGQAVRTPRARVAGGGACARGSAVGGARARRARARGAAWGAGRGAAWGGRARCMRRRAAARAQQHVLHVFAADGAHGEHGEAALRASGGAARQAARGAAAGATGAKHGWRTPRKGRAAACRAAAWARLHEEDEPSADGDERLRRAARARGRRQPRHPAESGPTQRRRDRARPRRAARRVNIHDQRLRQVRHGADRGVRGPTPAQPPRTARRPGPSAPLGRTPAHVHPRGRALGSRALARQRPVARPS